jgi:hypothetical protein
MVKTWTPFGYVLEPYTSQTSKQDSNFCHTSKNKWCYHHICKSILQILNLENKLSAEQYLCQGPQLGLLFKPTIKHLAPKILAYDLE